MPAESGFLPERARPRWLHRALAAGFSLIIALPLLGLWQSPEDGIAAFENRRPAPWPAWPDTRAALAEYPGAIERYVNDRFAGRLALIRLDHWFRAVALQVSPVPNVMIGKDKWLFFLGEDGRALDRYYRSNDLFGDRDVAMLRDELLRRRAALARRGIPYVVVVVPEKFSVYPEYLPDHVKPVAPMTPLDRVVAALAAHPELPFVDLRPALRASKARGRLYYKSDSHWTFTGALVGYEALSPAVAAVLPGWKSAPPPSPERYLMPENRYSGDLARMLGLPDQYRERDMTPLAPLLAGEASRCARPVTDAAPPGLYPASVFREVYACPRPGLPRALVYCDSQIYPLIPLLSENFSRAVYALRAPMDLRQIEHERPDIVIEEMVERALYVPAEQPLR
jgi:alginate O-acetyltransferase complex protein AlgJ